MGVSRYACLDSQHHNSLHSNNAPITILQNVEEGRTYYCHDDHNHNGYFPEQNVSPPQGYHNSRDIVMDWQGGRLHNNKYVQDESKLYYSDDDGTSSSQASKRSNVRADHSNDASCHLDDEESMVVTSDDDEAVLLHQEKIRETEQLSLVTTPGVFIVTPAVHETAEVEVLDTDVAYVLEGADDGDTTDHDDHCYNGNSCTSTAVVSCSSRGKSRDDLSSLHYYDNAVVVTFCGGFTVFFLLTVLATVIVSTSFENDTGDKSRIVDVASILLMALPNSTRAAIVATHNSTSKEHTRKCNVLAWVTERQ